MSRGRERVAMSPEEVGSFIASQRKVQLATLGADGAPHLTTLFYVVRHGRLAFWTYGSSQKVHNIRRDPRVSALVETGEAYDELRGVSIRGTARLVTAYDEVRAIGREVAHDLLGGTDLGEEGEALVAAQARKRVGVEIEPVAVASWDHAKMVSQPTREGESR